MAMVTFGTVAVNTDRIASVHEDRGYSYSQVRINLDNGKEVWIKDMSLTAVTERINEAMRAGAVGNG